MLKKKTDANVRAIQVVLVLLVIALLLPLGGLAGAAVLGLLVLGGFVAALSIADRYRVPISVIGAVSIYLLPVWVHRSDYFDLQRTLGAAFGLGVILTVVAVFHLALVRRR